MVYGLRAQAEANSADAPVEERAPAPLTTEKCALEAKGHRSPPNGLVIELRGPPPIPLRQQWLTAKGYHAANASP